MAAKTPRTPRRHKSGKKRELKTKEWFWVFVFLATWRLELIKKLAAKTPRTPRRQKQKRVENKRLVSWFFVFLATWRLGGFIKEVRQTMKREPTLEEDELARRLIGAAIEVHRVLGPGYLEKVYEEALAVEMTLQGIPFQRQPCVSVPYKGHTVGEGKLDFLVGGCLVVELKAVDSLAEIHRAQLISYLKVTGHCLGVLINFQVPVLKDGIKRVIYSL
ncbi:MAG: GxxExxY protein [Fimbriiglobus sp.]